MSPTTDANDAESCAEEMTSLEECKKMYRKEFDNDPKNAQEIRNRADRPKCVLTKGWGVQFFPKGKKPCIAWDRNMNKKLGGYGCYCKKLGT